MGWVKDEKFYCCGGHEKPIYWGDYLERWELGQFAKLAEGLSGVVFWRGVDTPMHTMNKRFKMK